MGGTIAATLAASHPERIARLVLAEAGLGPSDSEVGTMITGRPESDYIAGGHRQFVAMIRQMMHENAGLAGFAGALEIADPRAVYRSTVGLVRPTVPGLRERFLAMKVPRAYIIGEQSPPDPEVECLRSAGIPIIVVKSAGHGMMHDNPDGFATALVQAFES
jgi:pimeloyl-ACP methyl ester carboxylesterase